jgi:lysophospholipase L1-like esterase
MKDGLAKTVIGHTALKVVVTLTVLVALAWAMPAMYTAPQTRFPAKLVQLMSSRAVLYNPGVTGYYERLFSETHPMYLSPKEFDVWAQGKPANIYNRTFRIKRFRPNLDKFLHASQPQGLTTNSFGFLGPERSLQKPPHTRRAAVVGDSLAQGWGADQNRSFVSLLEKRLNASQPFEVLNFAVGGYGLTHMLDVAEEDVPRFHPDVYLLALSELPLFRNWDEHLAWTIRLGLDPKYDFLRDTIRRAGVSQKDDPMVILGELAPYRIFVLRNCLERMKARAARDGAPFLVILVPALEEADMTEMRFAGIRELLASLQIPVVDLLDTFNGRWDIESLRINPYDVHPNTRGHAMIAENLHAKLRARPDLWTALTGPNEKSPGK